MAKEPEDKHGASPADGENTPPETPSQDDPPSEATGDSGQSELPLGDELGEGGTKAEFPKVDFPQSDTQGTVEESETSQDDQAEDHDQHEDPHHAGEQGELCGGVALVCRSRDVGDERRGAEPSALSTTTGMTSPPCSPRKSVCIVGQW